ncbi:MAG: BON domain-containing protein [Acidobacteria bacterium]|nr:BON domain-containing protein [Acidobacteriota bacterium]
MKLKVFTITMLAAALFLSACGKSDADVAKAATDKLAAEKVTGVTVTVKDGVATLTGEVADATVKNKAEAAVRSVEGVKSVTNSVTLKPLPTPPPVADDKMLEGTINEGLKKAGIEGVTIEVKDGEVTFSGKVDKDKVMKVQEIIADAKPKKMVNNLNK